MQTVPENRITGSANAGLLRQGAAALAANRISDAEQSARELLRRDPSNPDALHLLAEAILRTGNTLEGERLLRQALIAAPGMRGARQRLALLLLQQHRFPEALTQADEGLKAEPGSLEFRDLKASILAGSGRMNQAIALYEALVGEHPNRPLVWMRYANALRAAGQQEACITAYRKAAALKPDLGEAWCSLANLKTFRFSANDIQALRAQVGRPVLGRDSRVAFEFALGKALGDESRFAESFEHYAAGNALWRSGLSHNPDATSVLFARCRELFTQSFFADRNGAGHDSASPIFIVGMPRAGSTLVEQILASHSAVEGLSELPEIMTIAAQLDREKTARYPAALSMLTPEERNRFGNAYIESTHTRRRQERPHFSDKMPNNFLHAGLIHLILPNAKIIDVRRDAMACCWSNFSHHFARGQQFTYDLAELGRFYADYVGFMDHLDRVLPGAIHRVSYEALIANPEVEIRTLLAYAGLLFEDGCLRFFETKRPISSASSEQVRLPLYRESLDFWRNYEPWLGPLKTALGPLAID